MVEVVFNISMPMSHPSIIACLGFDIKTFNINILILLSHFHTSIPSSRCEAYLYRPRSEGDNVLGSVRLSVRPSVSPLTAEPFDLRP